MQGSATGVLLQVSGVPQNFSWVVKNSIVGVLLSTSHKAFNNHSDRNKRICESRSDILSSFCTYDLYCRLDFQCIHLSFKRFQLCNILLSEIPPIQIVILLKMHVNIVLRDAFNQKSGSAIKAKNRNNARCDVFPIVGVDIKNLWCLSRRAERNI